MPRYCLFQLQRWRDLVIETDPDIIIGYNICNFDLPYLIKRAETLRVHEFPYWGRNRRMCALSAYPWAEPSTLLACACRWWPVIPAVPGLTL